MPDPFITAITADTLHPPFGNYSHAVSVTHGLPVSPGAIITPDVSWLITSGQLGISKDGAIPADVEAQTELCFQSIGALLAAAGMEFGDVVRLGAYVTRREDFAAYMRVRDRHVGSPPPASTLLIVGGFTRPEMLVEVEAIAVRRRPRAD